MPEKNIPIDIAGIHFNNKKTSRGSSEKKENNDDTEIYLQYAETLIRGIPENIFILPANVEFVNEEYRVSKNYVCVLSIYVQKIKYQN